MLINKRNKFYIEREKTYDIELRSLNGDKFISTIKEDFEINKKCKDIFFHIQNEEIIIRNIESIKTKRKKDIISLIKYEINQYMPIDLNNYHIRYKIIKTNLDEEAIQIILLPKNMSKICKQISDKLKINKSHLNINFDILDKILKLNLIKNMEDENAIIIENKIDSLIMNKVYQNQIIESYVLEKTKDTLNNIKDLCKNNKLYSFGVEDEYINNIKINSLEINETLNIYPLQENNKNITSFIMALGMAIE